MEAESESEVPFRRAVVSIGIDRVSTLPPLRSAASDARAVAAWAERQGCDVEVFVDDATNQSKNISRSEILEYIDILVEKRVYHQLIIYFAGHGLLMSPGEEVWLLSSAARDQGEGINLLKNSELARPAGIPHVVFISDACRKYVSGPPFNGMLGANIFPLGLTSNAGGAEIDTYFATTPGNPANEYKGDDSPGYGIFTKCLLAILSEPPKDIIDYIDLSTYARRQTTANVAIPVLTSRRLKTTLEKAVGEEAKTLSLLFSQKPQIRVETDLPQFLATVDERQGVEVSAAPPMPPVPPNDGNDDKPRVGGGDTSRPMSTTLQRGSTDQRDTGQMEGVRSSIRADIHTRELASREIPLWGSIGPWVSTGIAIFGTQLASVDVIGWEMDRGSDEFADYVRLIPPASPSPTSAVLRFRDGTGTVLAVSPGWWVSVVFDRGRVANLNYIKSDFNYDPGRHQVSDQEIEATAVANYYARSGNFGSARRVADRAQRLGHSLSFDNSVNDVIRSYAIHEAGLTDASSFQHIRNPLIPFDLVMLSGASGQNRAFDLSDPAISERISPFIPLMTRGWSFLKPDENFMWRTFHEKLSLHLVPALWTTLDTDGTTKALEALHGN